MDEIRHHDRMTPMPAAVRWQPRLENTVIGAFTVTPLLAFAHFRWIDLLIPTAMLAVVVLAVHEPRVRRVLIDGWMLRWSDPLVVAAAMTVTWMVLSVSWAPNLYRGLSAILQSAVIVAGAMTVGAFLKTIALDRIFRPLVGFTFTAVIAGMVGSSANKLLIYFDQPIAVLSDMGGAAPKLILFIFPVLGWLSLTGQRKQMVRLLVLSVLLVAVSRSGAAGFALAGGAAVICLGQIAPRLAVAVPLLLLLVGFASALYLNTVTVLLEWPDLAAYLSRFAARERISIWVYYASLFWEHPWRGFGFRAERMLDVTRFPDWLPGQGRLHPHNHPLQVLFQFGIIGATAVVATLALVTRRLMHPVRPASLFAAAAIASFLMAGLVNFSLWESWWLAVVSIVFVLSHRLLDGWGPVAHGPLPAT